MPGHSSREEPNTNKRKRGKTDETGEDQPRKTKEHKLRHEDEIEIETSPPLGGSADANGVGPSSQDRQTERQAGPTAPKSSPTAKRQDDSLELRLHAAGLEKCLPTSPMMDAPAAHPCGVAAPLLRGVWGGTRSEIYNAVNTTHGQEQSCGTTLERSLPG